VILFVLALVFLMGSGMPVFALPSDGSDLLKMERRILSQGGLERTYTLYLPHTYDSKTAAPLLVLLHGGGGIGKKLINFTGFDKLARQAGLIVVCPDGVDRHWNDGRQDTGHRAHEEQVDDVGFIAQLLDTLLRELNIDKTRVFVSGISNGAMMSYRLGLELPDRIAAIGTVAGALPEPLSAREWKGRTVPAIIINGTADPLVPFAGGEVHFYRKKLGRVISVPQTVAFWVRHNQCNPQASPADFPLKSNKSGLTVKKTSYSNCCSGADVEFYAVEGGGHTWPRDSLFSQYLPVAVIGKACRDMDATALIWDFFKKHPLVGKVQDK
jgi:polyhydroxybutyrate depolymerase